MFGMFARGGEGAISVVGAEVIIGRMKNEEEEEEGERICEIVYMTLDFLGIFHHLIF